MVGTTAGTTGSSVSRLQPAAGPPAVASDRPEISMVVVQPTGFCNIDCTYCYLPDRSNKHVMEQSTVTRLFSEVFASGWCDSQMIVLWHAGEPLAPGERLITLTPKNGRWTLVTDAWFFKEGEAPRWAAARFGEFRVTADGQALLVGLRGEGLRPL